MDALKVRRHNSGHSLKVKHWKCKAQWLIDNLTDIMEAQEVKCNSPDMTKYSNSKTELKRQFRLSISGLMIIRDNHR